MKIEGKSAFVRMEALFGKAKAQRNSNPLSGSGAQNGPYTDKVVLSPQARELQEIRQKFNTLPDVREQQIAAISRQIQGGQYQRSSEQAALGLIRETLFNGM
jgi:flagellar biosynthesis anti-sigma factor FlgM